MLKYLVIGFGGFLGAIARYVVGVYVGSRLGLRFPYGTFVINMSGCLLLGFIMALLQRSTASAFWRYLIPIGFIGAYTTFSTFEYETFRAMQDGEILISGLNVLLSVVIGFVSVWVGAVVGKVVL